MKPALIGEPDYDALIEKLCEVGVEPKAGDDRLLTEEETALVTNFTRNIKKRVRSLQGVDR